LPAVGRELPFGAEEADGDELPPPASNDEGRDVGFGEDKGTVVVVAGLELLVGTAEAVGHIGAPSLSKTEGHGVVVGAEEEDGAIVISSAISKDGI
jgi:hypothetical protein